MNQSTRRAKGTFWPRKGNDQDPLSRKQIVSIIALANKAWAEQDRHGLTDGLDRAEWRYRETDEVTAGRARSLKDCRQGDYLPLQTRFAALAGDSARAFKSAMREGQDNNVRLALHQLEALCLALGKAFPEYPGEISRDMYKNRITDCTAAQIWAVHAQIRNTARGRIP